MAILEKFNNRNSSIELLRLWFMLMIVTIHAYGHGCGLDYDYLYSLGSDLSTAHHLGLLSLGKCGVTGFVFISGYYGISLKRNKIGAMVAMLLFYILLLAAIGGQGLGIVKSMLHPWDSWWFIGSYIVICVLAPIINKGIEALTKPQFRNILLFMIFYEYVGKFIGMDNSHDTIFMLTIFTTARYTRLYITPSLCKNSKRRKFVVWTAFFSGMVLFTLPILFSMVGGEKLNKLFISNNNILLVVFTTCLVITLDRMKFVNKYINYMSASTLAIYLLTDNGVTRKPLDTWLLKELLDGAMGVVYILAVAILCLVIDKVRECLFGLTLQLLHKSNVKSIISR